jgi:hypothetical protein
MRALPSGSNMTATLRVEEPPEEPRNIIGGEGPLPDLFVEWRIPEALFTYVFSNAPQDAETPAQFEGSAANRVQFMKQICERNISHSPCLAVRRALVSKPFEIYY